VKGSGAVQKANRTIPPFEKVTIIGSIDVSGTLGSQSIVTISGDSNIIHLIKTEVVDGELTIAPKDDFIATSPLKVVFKTKSLKAAEIGGSSDVSLLGMKSTTFKLDVSGSSNVYITGQVGGLDLKVSGSGNIRANDYKAQKAHVKISGSGDATVHVVGQMRVDISGSGNLNYHGKPTLSQSISGSGDIKALD